MIINPTPPEEPADKGRAKYAFLVLIPIAVALLLGPDQLAGEGLRKAGEPRGLLITFNIITLFFCFIAGIGMCGGFKKASWNGTMGGIMVGLLLWVVVDSIVMFVGCCQGLSGNH